MTPAMPTVDRSSLYVVSRARVRVDEEDLAHAERELEAPLPSGYRAFVRELGTGTFSSILGIHGPQEVVERHRAFVEGGILGTAPSRFANWSDLLTPADGARLFPVACSLDGDEVCAHLDAPDMLFVLPRHRDMLAPCASFEEALGWFAFSGAYWPKVRRPWFEPTRTTEQRTISFPEKRVDDVIDLLSGELAPDADDGGDPLLTLFYARAGAVVHCHGGRLDVRVDPGSGAFIEELSAAVERLLSE